MNTPETESTDFLREVQEMTEYFTVLRQEIEYRIQGKYPGARIKLILRDILLESECYQKGAGFIKVFNEEYIVTPTGVTDTHPEYQNSKLFISYKPKNKTL
jgi:hypothetical protein